MEISDWRDRIDVLDAEIVRLINQRAEAAQAIGKLKHAAGLPVYEPKREEAVFERIRKANAGPLPDTAMVNIYERIIDVMRTLQKKDQ